MRARTHRLGDVEAAVAAEALVERPRFGVTPKRVERDGLLEQRAPACVGPRADKAARLLEDHERAAQVAAVLERLACGGGHASVS